MKGTGRHVASTLIVVAMATASLVALTTGTLRPLLGLDLVGGVSVILTAPQGTAEDVVDKTLETIRNRVDAFGVAEPDITRQGALNIQVQIPAVEGQAGGDRQERLLQLIGQTAQLEFREVLGVISPGDRAYDRTAITPGSPRNREVVFPGENEAGGPEVKYRLGPVLMTGDAVERAVARFIDPTTVTNPGDAGWQVVFDLTDEGGEQFAELTRDLVGKGLAIVLDRRVESAPNVNEEIPGGSGNISGNFTEAEAKDLALVLRTGALPVQLVPSQVETVSATLGRESLQQGLVAGIAGLIALALYLAFYYRLLGVVTWVGMAIWGALALGMVALLGQTAGYSLTLAGVAGIVVSLGITADSYVVFYERLKDEVRHGKTVRAAVGPAFKRAWRTIVAADIVTITAAVILYLLAIGSVRGFALTLGLSTFLDMFVVYFFKRPTVFLIARSRWLSELPGMGLRSGVAVATEPQPVRGAAK
ncbi:MAG: protein translocase subunit SecD [Actinomycetota bacterium]